MIFLKIKFKGKLSFNLLGGCPRIGMESDLNKLCTGFISSRVEFIFCFSYFFCLCFFVITSVRVPPLSLRGYEGWATCGQNTLTGSPLDSLTSFFAYFCFQTWDFRSFGRAVEKMKSGIPGGIP